MNNVPTIICVLKSGGPYTPVYVDRLYNSLLRNTSKEFKFICLTDLPQNRFEVVKAIKLKHDWRGWWSKIEMFKYSGTIITMDIDILIIGNADTILELPYMIGKDEIFMMKAINPNRTYTTSIMAWNGSFKYIYNEFNFLSDKEHKWDQFYILSKLKNKRIHAVQSHVPGIYSYKRHWIETKPVDTRMFLFHGHPRLHEYDEPIFRKHWR